MIFWYVAALRASRNNASVVDIDAKNINNNLFGCPKADIVSISWRVIDVMLGDGHPIFKTIGDDITVECSFDDALLECDKILAEHS
jgi:hypothetical protein